jgi:hypothetical protein
LRWTGSGYDVLGGLLELTANELAAEGFQVVLFVTNDDNWPRRLLGLLQQGGFAFAMGMSGLGADLRVQGGQLLWEAVQVPFFSWNCDHPCRFPRRHGIRSRFVMHGYVFPDHARYTAQYLNPNGATYTAHIGMPPREIFADAPLPLARRNGRILFAKSSGDTNAIETRWRGANPLLKDTLFEAAEALFHRGVGEFVPILQEVAARRGLLLDGNSVLTLTLIRELEAYIRFRHSNLVAEVVMRHPVDVFGAGWEHFDWSRGRADYRGTMQWGDLARQLPHYLACLSTNPLIEESVHDRVFFALAASVVPTSSGNTFSREHMPALERYNFSVTREAIERAVDALLSDPEDALARTEATYQAMLPEFSMRGAARRIVQFAALHGSNMRCSV